MESLRFETESLNICRIGIGFANALAESLVKIRQFDPNLRNRLARIRIGIAKKIPGLVGMKKNFFEIHRDNTRQVRKSRESGGFRDNLEIPQFPQLFPTLVLCCPQKIPFFCSIFEVIRGPKIQTYLDIFKVKSG